MFDGQNVFFDDNATYGKSWGVGRYLNYTKTPLIVVALECNTHPDNGRLSEYSPFYYNPGGEWGGPYEARAEETMQWYIHNLKPYIDKRFRTLTDREHTFIGGSSMGGLMSLYAAVRYNRWFSKAACLSSTIGPCMEDFREDIVRCDISADTRVYLSWGSEEGGGSKMYPRCRNCFLL